MPTTAPGADRARLEFAEAARASFEFLVRDWGFSVVDVQPTFVRYESDRAFVNVFHGRASYELGVQIGRWIEIDGRKVEQRFPLGDAIALDHDLSSVGYRLFATTEREPLARFVAQLAAWTEQFGAGALRGDAATFDAMSVANSRRAQHEAETWRATTLRAAADAAWRAKDWGRVVDAYGEMLSELRTVELKSSELRKLRYAQDRLGSE